MIITRITAVLFTLCLSVAAHALIIDFDDFDLGPISTFQVGEVTESFNFNNSPATAEIVDLGEVYGKVLRTNINVFTRLS